MTDPQPEPRTTIPPGVLCARDYERLAADVLPPALFAHVAGGSADDRTARANLAAFAALAIRPRLLRDVTGGHIRTALPDRERPHPIFLAPVAGQDRLHPGAELDTARAAAVTEAGLIVSTLSSATLEQVAAAAGPDRWFQLYVQPDRGATLDLVRRAEAAGYGALVVTLDAPLQAPSFRALRAGYQSPPEIAPNLAEYPTLAHVRLAPGQSRIFQGLMRPAPTWDDLDCIRAATSLPVWVKGVLHPDDAVALAARGIAGLIVSNHGGRSLDGAVASLEALPAVRAAVGDRTPLLVDGGIRSGSDILKAVALGADGILVGRLQAYALAVAGALGVAHMVRLLREELELCMALAGCATLADIRRDAAGLLVRTAQPGGPPC